MMTEDTDNDARFVANLFPPKRSGNGMWKGMWNDINGIGKGGETSDCFGSLYGRKPRTSNRTMKHNRGQGRVEPLIFGFISVIIMVGIITYEVSVHSGFEEHLALISGVLAVFVQLGFLWLFFGQKRGIRR